MHFIGRRRLSWLTSPSSGRGLSALDPNNVWAHLPRIAMVGRNHLLVVDDGVSNDLVDAHASPLTL